MMRQAARFCLCAASLGFVLSACGTLTAQQPATATAIATNSSLVAIPQQSSDASGSRVETRLLSPSALESAGVSSSAAALDGASNADDGLQATQQSTPDAPAPQTKRILGIIPNFRAISTDVKLPPQSVKDKFMDATQDSFDYSSIVLPGLLAAYSMGTDATPEFHQGAAGYARYFWHAAVDQTSENYMVEFVVPSITHEDTRYYT